MNPYGPGNVDPACSLRGLVSRRLEILTLREEQVAALVAEGFSSRDIAGELNLGSPGRHFGGSLQGVLLGQSFCSRSS
jgi:hypothetical protein